MDGDHPGGTFISYSRRDGADFTRDLRATLKKENLSVWQDLVALEGGQDWWSQIENALRSRDLHHSILVVTPQALESAVVKQEIRLSRQEGKSVSPVRGPGLVDLAELPRWLGHIYDLAIPEQKTAIIARLKRDAEPRRVVMMAPEPPPDFVARPKEFDALKTRLLSPGGDSVTGITAALRGAGGYGKTTLAKALARDPEIQDAYFDGILWAELGEKDPVGPRHPAFRRAAATRNDPRGRSEARRNARRPHDPYGRRRRLAQAGPGAVPAGRPELRPPRHHPDRQCPAARGPAPETRRDAGRRGASPALGRPAAR